MADEEQEVHSLASTFPNPPPFWKDFTPDNLQRIKELRKAHDGPSDSSIRIPGLPDDLINLQPPAEPSDGRWRVFGDQYMLDDKLPTLEDQGITNLPATHPSRTTITSSSPPPSKQSHYDHALELKRLTKSLLLNFLELAGTLSSSPAHAPDKISDLRTLLINIHHALNEYRPHQAREQAAEMMQEHLDRTRRETVAVRSQVDRARRVLEGLGSLGLVGEVEKMGRSLEEDEKSSVASEDGRRERELGVWRAVDAAFT